MRIFDYHVHSLDPIQFNAFFNLTEQGDFTKAHSYIPDHTANMKENISRTIAEFDKNNVVAGLISGPRSGVYIDKHPDRFYTSFQLNLGVDIEAQLVQFEEGIKSGKIHGLGELGLTYAGISLDTELLYPFYEICEKNEVPVLFHAGLNGPNPTSSLSKWSVAKGDPLFLEPVLGSFPRLISVIAHFGYPFVDNTMYMLATYSNCYADLSVLNWMLGEKIYHRILVEAVDAVGSEKLLYGSDQMIWPQMISKSVEYTMNSPLEEKDLDNIFFGTAQSILKVLR